MTRLAAADRRFALPLLWLLLTGGQLAHSAPPTNEGRSTDTGQLEVLFTSDIFGRFAWPGCKKRPDYRAELSHLVSAVRTLTVQSQLQGRDRPLVVAAGSMTRMDVLGEYIFDQRADLAARLVAQLARLRFDAVAVGMHDFGAPPRALANYTELMKRHGIALLAGNVSCRQSGDYRCGRLGGADGRRYVVVERSGLRVGIFALLRADLLSRIQQRSADGLVVANPLPWARSTLEQLRRREKVDVTIALTGLNLEGTAPDDVMSFVRALGDEAPDLVVASQMYDPGTDAYIKQLRYGRTTVVGTDRFGQHIGRVSMQYERRGGRTVIGRVSVYHRPIRDFEANAVTASELNEVMKAFCAKLDQPIGAVSFARPLRYVDFLDYVLQVMRLWAHAEVALLNKSSTADTSFPMDGVPTWEKLLRALRTHTTVGWVELYGSRLIELIGPHVTNPDAQLRVAGLQIKDDVWFVNGRPVIAGERYRVATTAFVARGGDSLIALSPLERFHARSMTLRALISRFWAQGGAARDGDPKIDLDEDFPDLRDEWLIHASAAFGFAVSDVRVSNGGGDGRYAQPLLQRDEVANLSGELKLTAGASTRNHALDADLQLQLGGTKTPDDSGWLEAQDRIAATTIYVWHQLRDTYGQGRWYVPEPFAETRVTTEFSAPADRAHYVDFSGTLGAGLTLHPLMFLKIGAILLVSPRSSIGTDSDELLARPGLYFGYRLKRWRLFAETAHPLDLESRLDCILTDLTGTRRRGELTWQSTAWFELTRFIRLTLTHRLFLLDTREMPASLANDISFGLALLFDLRRQTF